MHWAGITQAGGRKCWEPGVGATAVIKRRARVGVHLGRLSSDLKVLREQDRWLPGQREDREF